MKVIIEVSEKKLKEIDLEFPLYRRQFLDYSELYYKITSINSAVVVHLFEEDNKVEIELGRTPMYMGEDFLIGKSYYTSTESEFNKAIEKAKAILNSI